jgi:hypothetical protein
MMICVDSVDGRRRIYVSCPNFTVTSVAVAVKGYQANCDVGRTFEYRWAGALSEAFSLKPSSCSSKSKTSSGLCSIGCRYNRSQANHDGSFMFDHVMPLSQAPEGYTLFEQRKTQKVVFTP